MKSTILYLLFINTFVNPIMVSPSDFFDIQFRGKTRKILNIAALYFDSKAVKEVVPHAPGPN